MCRHFATWLSRCGPLLLATAWIPATSGCAMFPGAQSAQPRASDAMGEGLRGIPKSNVPAAGASAAKKQPFWEKYRDKRVQQINEHLNVDEPAGW
jgi:hypothetical protein